MPRSRACPRSWPSSSRRPSGSRGGGRARAAPGGGRGARGGEPAPPEGGEVVVSTAFAGAVAGRSRAEFLAELVSFAPGRSLVVSGAHGKTTTAAMIAFVLRETGRDPSWLVGGEVPQLGGNAGAGAGGVGVGGEEC